MLRFLRQLRWASFFNRKMKNYSLYAIGEIMLIVVGVFIAVQVNEWYKQKEFEKTEKVYLEKLMDDLRQDRRNFQFLDSVYLLTEKECEAALSFFDQTQQAEERVKVIGYRFLSFFEPTSNTATYTEMLNTGQLYALKNDLIRTKIIGYYNFLERETKSIERSNDRVRTLMDEALLTDYWLIVRRRNNNMAIDLDHFPWLENAFSDEMKAWEKLAMTASSSYAKNQRRAAILLQENHRLIQDLAAYLK